MFLGWLISGGSAFALVWHGLPPWDGEIHPQTKQPDIDPRLGNILTAFTICDSSLASIAYRLVFLAD
jgi:hypothetical protein